MRSSGWMAASLALTATVMMNGAHAVPENVRLQEGLLFVVGKRVFLKIGKPLRNFADAGNCRQLVSELPILAEKGYNCLELNCYWHQFDADGDGVPDRSLEPLAQLIDAIADADMFPCLSVETYGVGGGQIPSGFWERRPDAVAVNSEGQQVMDTEYGFGSAVPSIHGEAYQAASRDFIRNLTSGLPHERLLWFETTVEPQYIGNQSIDYSKHARVAYEEWLARENVEGPAWPEALPAPMEFVNDPVWNRFRAEALAEWINEDAAAFREVAGAGALVAVDYLETAGPEMRNRNGGSLDFLTHLTCANVIQVNWHWHLGTRSPNIAAYGNVWAIRRATGRDWAISEHMTLNGSDYRPDEVAPMLENTLEWGTGLGWEFTNISPSSADSFCQYNDDWSPKPLIAEVDARWAEWVERAMAQPSTVALRDPRLRE